MSKAVKKLFKAVKKTVKWVAKNIVPILAVAAIVYTGGAALGYFQGAATAGGGATGMAGIQAAWGVGGSAAGGAANSALMEAGAAEGASAAAGAEAAMSSAGLELGAADAAANAAILDVGATEGAAAVANAAASAPGLMLPTAVSKPIGASVLDGLGKAAGGAGKFMATPGGGIATAAGVQAIGAYLDQTAAEKARREELDRFNSETNAYGLNRYGQPAGTGAQVHDFAQDFTFNPGGLMAPAVQAPTPTTIDELIAARQQQARA